MKILSREGEREREREWERRIRQEKKTDQDHVFDAGAKRRINMQTRTNEHAICVWCHTDKINMCSTVASSCIWIIISMCDEFNLHSGSLFNVHALAMQQVQSQRVNTKHDSLKFCRQFPVLGSLFSVLALFGQMINRIRYYN